MLRPILAAWILSSMAGCSLISLNEDLKKYDETVAEASGTLRSTQCPECVTIVVVTGPQAEPLSYKVFERPGEFRILLSPRAQGVFAFHDANHNLEFDRGEPFAWHAIDDGQSRAAATRDLLLDIGQPSSTGAQPTPPAGSLFKVRTKLVGDVDIQLGRLTDLDQPAFDPEMAALGMWQPTNFLKSGLVGIYFLEPYSPKKIPVLFVHGVNGTPRDFSTLAARLDRNRYQPWFFYYPSGLEIPTLGHGLLGILNKLWAERPFSQLHIVAHSMGGLVTRSFLNACGEENECDFVRSFTSISSPFAGVKEAKSGLEYAPVVMPVWKSMSPESTFVQTLFSTPLATGVKHHMIFGYRNTTMLSATSSDGTVTLESQLPGAAQEQASSVRGFNEDHISILHSTPVCARIDAIISENSR